MVGHDYQAVLDDLDELVDGERTPPLLVSIGCVQNLSGKEPKFLWRYRFADELVHAYYFGIADDRDRERFSRLLLDQLTRIHLPDGTYDAEIGRIARNLEEHKLAKLIEDRHWARLKEEQSKIEAFVLLSMVEGWDDRDLYLCDALYECTRTLNRIGLYGLALKTGQAAVALAHAHPCPPVLSLVSTSFEMATAYCALRDERAQAHLTEAARYASDLHGQSPTRYTKRMLSSIRYYQGMSHRHSGEFRHAVDHLVVARRMGQELWDTFGRMEDRTLVSDAVFELGRTYIDDGQVARGLAFLEEVLRREKALYEERPGPSEHTRLGIVLQDLGRVELDHNGNGVAASAYLEQAVEVFNALNKQQPTQVNLYNLAVSQFLQGKAWLLCSRNSAAVETLHQAAHHHDALLERKWRPVSRASTAEVHYKLALAHTANKDPERALASIERAYSLTALDLAEGDMGVSKSLAMLRHEAGVIYRDTGRSDLALVAFSDALGHALDLEGLLSGSITEDELEHLQRDVDEAKS